MYTTIRSSINSKTSLTPLLDPIASCDSSEATSVTLSDSEDDELATQHVDNRSPNKLWYEECDFEPFETSEAVTSLIDKTLCDTSSLFDDEDDKEYCAQFQVGVHRGQQQQQQISPLFIGLDDAGQKAYRPLFPGLEDVGQRAYRPQFHGMNASLQDSNVLCDTSSVVSEEEDDILYPVDFLGLDAARRGSNPRNTGPTSGRSGESDCHGFSFRSLFACGMDDSEPFGTLGVPSSVVNDENHLGVDASVEYPLEDFLDSALIFRPLSREMKHASKFHLSDDKDDSLFLDLKYSHSTDEERE